MKKFLMVFLLVLVLSVGTTAAVWSLIQNSEEETAATLIGTGRVVTVSVTPELSADEVLVPIGQINNSNEANAVSSIIVLFDVLWQDSAMFSTTSTIDITLSSYTLGSLTETEITDLFTFEIVSDNSITKDVVKTIVINITFENEPATVAIYNEVASGTLEFNVAFTVVVPENPNL